MSEQRQQQRLRWVGIGLAAAAGITVFAGTARFWWPAVGTWWWTLLAVAAAVTGGALVRRSRRLDQPAGASSAPNPDTAEAQQPRRGWNWSSITSVITALTALAALAFTAQSLSATRDQINIDEQGQINDRYSRAVDQIGAQGPDHLETRLGGIYAMGLLAVDAPTDRPIIVEVLSAFLRSSLGLTTQPGGCPSVNTTALPPPALDVQAALTNVFALAISKENGGKRIDLTDICLNGMSLRGLVLSDADLNDANLAGSDLTGAEFIRTDFTAANLSGANLSSADVAGANLLGAQLIGANLSGANFSGADLTFADVTGAVHDKNTRMDGVSPMGTAATRGAWW